MTLQVGSGAIPLFSLSEGAKDGGGAFRSGGYARERFGLEMVDAEKLLKAEVRVERRRMRLLRTLEEKKRLKWLHLILLASPLGLFWAWWMMAWIVFAWITFWGVGRYMNYFHLREAEARLAKAEAERELVQAEYNAENKSNPPLAPQAALLR